jgi:hypothetical protein
MLEKAIHSGFEHYDWFKRDPDLENIREEPKYIELMKGKLNPSKGHENL